MNRFYSITVAAVLLALATPHGLAQAGSGDVTGGIGGSRVWIKARQTDERISDRLRFGGRPNPSGFRQAVTDDCANRPIDNLCVGGGRAPLPDCVANCEPAAAALPPVTTTTVATALRTVGLPALQVRTQPEGKTLVNFDTIFYTEPEPFARTVTLLGQRVRIVATPSSYTWYHGDGTSARTTRPGAPYPAKDVTYRYRDGQRTVRTSVDVTYTARFSVAGGPWQTIPGAVTISGPTSPLRISEASPMLSGDYSWS